MGVLWCYSVIFWVIVALCAAKSTPALVKRDTEGVVIDICSTIGCNCLDKFKTWITINCTFNSTQKFQFNSGSIPQNTLEISISGGEEIILLPYSLTPSLAFFRIDQTKNFIIRKNGFYNSTSPSFTMEIENCNKLVVESNAFSNTQSTIYAKVRQCMHVSIQSSAFSFLLKATFQNISYLELAENAFSFENKEISKHGPVSKLKFENTIIPKIPRATFPSVLAAIKIQNSQVREIHPQAFWATQIETIEFINSSLSRIQQGAFNDRTLILLLIFQRCKIGSLESGSVMAAVGNLLMQFSDIKAIHSEAFNTTVAQASITDNQIQSLQKRAFVFHNCNRVKIENNVIKHMHSFIMDIPYSVENHLHELTFTGNEIYRVESSALDFIARHRRVDIFKFDDNFFDVPCSCDIDKWIAELLGNETDDVLLVLNTSFCRVNRELSQCFELPQGIINMRNITELVCGTLEYIKCETYSGETKIIDPVTSLPKEDETNDYSSLILGIVLGSLLVIAVSGTIVILLIRAGLWLKRKGYCMRFRNFQYHNDTPSTEEETDVSTRVEVPEVTEELLRALREQLHDPATHDEACDMIIVLYEALKNGDSYTNNNRQDDDDQHLYEELENLQRPNHLEAERTQTENVDNASELLRQMDEIYNLVVHNTEPVLTGEYSQPTDAAEHQYSEPQQNKDVEEDKKNSIKSQETNTQRSNTSSNMAFRPLPEKPKEYDPKAGPSCK